MYIQAVVDADRTLDNLAIANEKLRVDIEKWKEAKDHEMSELCTTFADNHISYHKRVSRYYIHGCVVFLFIAHPFLVTVLW